MPYNRPSQVPSYVPKQSRAAWLHVFNTEWEKHKDKPAAERERIAFSSANSVAGQNTSRKFAKLLDESKTDFANAFADAVIKEIENYWKTLPAEIRPGLESATLSGVGNGMLQIDVSNASLISSSNAVAQDYARERSAEMVGMTRDVEGNLIPNPDANWAISDLTRQRIREIIVEAFSADTPIDQVKTEIQAALEEEATDSGIFSAERAQLIAETEISNAQVRGNFMVWQQSGVVKTLRWLTSEDEKVCPTCDDNDNVVVEIGKPFPSGDLYPTAHPGCRCVIVVDSVA